MNIAGYARIPWSHWDHAARDHVCLACGWLLRLPGPAPVFCESCHREYFGGKRAIRRMRPPKPANDPRYERRVPCPTTDRATPS